MYILFKQKSDELSKAHRAFSKRTKDLIKTLCSLFIYNALQTKGDRIKKLSSMLRD